MIETLQLYMTVGALLLGCAVLYGATIISLGLIFDLCGWPRWWFWLSWEDKQRKCYIKGYLRAKEGKPAHIGFYQHLVRSEMCTCWVDVELVQVRIKDTLEFWRMDRDKLDLHWEDKEKLTKELDNLQEWADGLVKKAVGF